MLVSRSNSPLVITDFPYLTKHAIISEFRLPLYISNFSQNQYITIKTVVRGTAAAPCLTMQSSKIYPSTKCGIRLFCLSRALLFADIKANSLAKSSTLISSSARMLPVFPRYSSNHLQVLSVPDSVFNNCSKQVCLSIYIVAVKRAPILESAKSFRLISKRTD